MKGIRSKVIKTVVAVAIILSIVVGTIIYFIEMENIDKKVVDLANSETTYLISSVNNINSSKEKYNELSKRAVDMLSSHFLIIEMYDKDKKKFLEYVQQENKHLEDVVDKMNHNFSLEDKIVYEKMIIDNNLYLQVLVPLKDKDNTLIGYLEGVYEVNNEQLIALKQRVFYTVIQTILIVIVTTLVLTPIIFALNKNLFTYSSKLLRANVDTLRVLGGAVSKRDTDTDAHNYRVTIYSVKIAEKIKMSHEEMRKLIKGAFVHDVGKIGIPDQILLKPGKLTEEEFEVMKLHVKHGVDIINESEWLEDATDIVLYHHEKYNGTGYLNGLSGEDIPLNARIFAIADVFDALTSERPYKKPFSYDVAIEILKEGKGQHFDPNLIEVFIGVSKEIYSQIANCEDKKAKEILNELLDKYFYDE